MASVEQQEILRTVEDVWNENDIGLVDEFIAEEFVGHMLGDEDIHGVEGYKDWVRGTLAAFPDGELTFDTGTNVIDVYINFLRKKIDRGFEKKLIHTQIGMGYVLREEE